MEPKTEPDYVQDWPPERSPQWEAARAAYLEREGGGESDWRDLPPTEQDNWYYLVCLISNYLTPSIRQETEADLFARLIEDADNQQAIAFYATEEGIVEASRFLRIFLEQSRDGSTGATP